MCRVVIVGRISLWDLLVVTVLGMKGGLAEHIRLALLGLQDFKYLHPHNS